MKKILALMCFYCVLLIALSSCSLTSSYSKSKDIEVITLRDSLYYIYSNKVAVLLRYGDYGLTEDELVFKTEVVSLSEEWLNTADTELKGNFEKIAYNAGNLFIIMEDSYFVVDISKYYIYEYTDDYFFEYTQDEFVKLYPDYEDYDWVLAYN